MAEWGGDEKEETKIYHPADTNGDGVVDDEEHRLYMEFKRKELEDKDAQRDAIRKMAWFALTGLLVYPFGIFLADALSMGKSAELIADIAPTYFASIAVLVAAFFGADAMTNTKKK
jgi:ABC-type transport system involved in cytochrome c biogenesis permease component